MSVSDVVGTLIFKQANRTNANNAQPLVHENCVRVNMGHVLAGRLGSDSDSLVLLDTQFPPKCVQRSCVRSSRPGCDSLQSGPRCRTLYRGGSQPMRPEPWRAILRFAELQRLRLELLHIGVAVGFRQILNAYIKNPRRISAATARGLLGVFEETRRTNGRQRCHT